MLLLEMRLRLSLVLPLSCKVPYFTPLPLFSHDRFAHAPDLSDQLRIVQTSVSVTGTMSRGNLTAAFYAATWFHSVQLAPRFGMFLLGRWFEASGERVPGHRGTECCFPHDALVH